MPDLHDDTTIAPPLAGGHEDSDVAIRPLAIFLAGLVLSLVVVGGIVRWQLRRLENRAEATDLPAHPLAAAERRVPGPHLQVSGRLDYQEFHQREVERLTSSGWVDRGAGIVHIPISQAIQLAAQNGLPTWPAPTPPAGAAGSSAGASEPEGTGAPPAAPETPATLPTAQN